MQTAALTRLGEGGHRRRVADEIDTGARVMIAAGGQVLADRAHAASFKRASTAAKMAPDTSALAQLASIT